MRALLTLGWTMAGDVFPMPMEQGLAKMEELEALFQDDPGIISVRSHISGVKDSEFEVLQVAIEMGGEGWLIEGLLLLMYETGEKVGRLLPSATYLTAVEVY